MVKILLASLVVAWLAFALVCPTYSNIMHNLMGTYDNPFKQTETTNE